MQSINDTEWQNICQDLLDHHSLFYKVGEMGRPFFTDSIPTACVTFDKSGKFLNFLFNPEFWNNSTDYEKRFVICHESLHIILSHGKRFADSKESIAANYAMDVVVNHSLVNRFGFVREEISGWKDYCWVDTLFKGKKANNLDIPEDETAEYYLNLLKRFYPNEKNIKELSLVDSHDFSDQEMKEIFEALNDHLSDEEKESLRKFCDKQNQNNKAGKNQGSGLYFVPKTKVAQVRKWETVIQKWTKYKMLNIEKTNDQWARKHRRFSMIKSNMFLPSELDVEDMSLEKNKLMVYFFCDTSGSCWHLKDRFFKAAESLPKKYFDVKLYCFDTIVYQTDLKQRKMLGGGGTSFEIIEKFIQKDCKENRSAYPDSVWVITDGHGDSVIPAQAQNWHWFISEHGTTRFLPPKSKFYELSDFC